MQPALRTFAIGLTALPFCGQVLAFFLFERIARQATDLLAPLETAEIVAGIGCLIWLLALYVAGFGGRRARRLVWVLLILPIACFGILTMAYGTPAPLAIASALFFPQIALVRLSMRWTLEL